MHDVKINRMYPDCIISLAKICDSYRFLALQNDKPSELPSGIFSRRCRETGSFCFTQRDQYLPFSGSFTCIRFVIVSGIWYLSEIYWPCIFFLAWSTPTIFQWLEQKFWICAKVAELFWRTTLLLYMYCTRASYIRPENHKYYITEAAKSYHDVVPFKIKNIALSITDGPLINRPNFFNQDVD